MTKAETTKSRLRSYFERDTTKPKGIVAIVNHFSDIKVHNLNYHLRMLVEEGFVMKVKRGTYQKNPDFKSPSEHLRLVDEHIRTNGSPIASGGQWKPGDDVLKEVVNPSMLSYLGQSFGESITVRMKSSGFTEADVVFVEGLLRRVYPLSDQERTQCSKAFAGERRVPSSAASNGHYGSGSS